FLERFFGNRRKTGVCAAGIFQGVRVIPRCKRKGPDGQCGGGPSAGPLQVPRSRVPRFQVLSRQNLEPGTWNLEPPAPTRSTSAETSTACPRSELSSHQSASGLKKVGGYPLLTWAA